MKKQRQSPAFGRKSEALNPKSETILQSKANFIGAQIGAKSFAGERYENKSRRRLQKNKANFKIPQTLQKNEKKMRVS